MKIKKNVKNNCMLKYYKLDKTMDWKVFPKVRRRICGREQQGKTVMNFQNTLYYFLSCRICAVLGLDHLI